jgi:hypothetical protein
MSAAPGGGLADGVDLVGVEGLKELSAAGEVAVESRHADAGASRDLGHRYLRVGTGECGAGGREDLGAVALGVSTSRGWRELVGEHGNLIGQPIRYPLA